MNIDVSLDPKLTKFFEISARAVHSLFVVTIFLATLYTIAATLTIAILASILFGSKTSKKGQDHEMPHL